MSCFGCSRKYGLFCKEYGCPNCGYSYCSKCLKRPMAVPRHNGKVMNVCLICYDKLSKMQAPEKVIDVEALPGTLVTKGSRFRTTSTEESPGVAAGTTNPDSIFDDVPPAELGGEILMPISQSTATSTDQHSAATEASSEIDQNLDSVISKRLKDLKTPDNMQTDEQLRARLENLTGLPQKDYSHKDILLNTDQRTDQEKTQDLLRQFMGEVDLDKRVESERVDAIADIERRLKALRGAPADEAATTSSAAQGAGAKDNTPSDNEDDETVLKGIMEKYLAEARLPEVSSSLEAELESSLPLPPPGTKPEDTEELPWCNICNEDAIYRCKGCDGELFCGQCYRECHDDDEEFREHVKEAYSAPPKFKENHF